MIYEINTERLGCIAFALIKIDFKESRVMCCSIQLLIIRR